MTYIFIGIGILVIVLAYLLSKKNSVSNSENIDNTNDATKPSGEEDPDQQARLFKLIGELEAFYDQAASPNDLLNNRTFDLAVELLCRPDFTHKTLIDYAFGANWKISYVALEALSRRPTENPAQLADQIIEYINQISTPYWARFFGLRVIDKKSPQAAANKVIQSLGDGWVDTMPAGMIRDFLQQRAAGGDVITPVFDPKGFNQENAENYQNTLKAIGDPVNELLKSFQKWEKQRVDPTFFQEIGQVNVEISKNIWPIENPNVEKAAEVMLDILAKEKPRSVVVVGESGVGKSMLIDKVTKQMFKEGWTIFNASAGQVLAGQVYIGELEERINKLIKNMQGRKIVWVVPNFHELQWAGRHKYSQTSVLDMLMRNIEMGNILLIGETQPDAWERLIQASSVLRDEAMKVIRLNPTTSPVTLALGTQWAEKRNDNFTIIEKPVLKEAFQLAEQYMGERAAPGNLLLFLEQTWQHISAGGTNPERSIVLEDLLATLAQLTGLPLSVLDSREGLDLTALRTAFNSKVMGQQEAVNCLVERIAMIKAGLTDPTRPQGVFLFVGPTGTGKTEIAKTLSEFLFGSSERMLRLDMSEFQSPDTITRITGEFDPDGSGQSTSLVSEIRKQPFSVILLDEFEKANPRIWDLFLQVFDDGRLTDRQGKVANFRHSIVILTSNLGSTIPTGDSIGFASGLTASGQSTADGFASRGVEKMVAKTFRREFVNRIDRIVVFKPLGRNVMRKILQSELDAVLGRRGLRNRSWAVEWDDSAIDFLLERGFTPDLGARPLKRAVEQYLLSPLALTIVGHHFPEGEQFLFVRSDGNAIQVEFVDPNADENLGDTQFVGEIFSGEDQSLKSLILHASGRPADVQFLNDQFNRIAKVIDDPVWDVQKDAHLQQMAEADFWNQPERFTVLSAAEYMDRLETGLGTADVLLRRLLGDQDEVVDKSYGSNLVQRLAQQLFLLDAGLSTLDQNHPHEAYLYVEAIKSREISHKQLNEFAIEIMSMYENWNTNRRMRMKTLSEQMLLSKPVTSLFVVSGYGCWEFLQHEVGLHVLEVPQEKGAGYDRIKVRVKIAAVPAGRRRSLQEQRDQAADLLSQTPSNTRIVRRYREFPSPLVRDSVQNWRTGKLAAVLDGHFDVIGGNEEEFVST